MKLHKIIVSFIALLLIHLTPAQANPNKEEGYACMAWLYELEQLASKKKVLVADFFKLHSATVDLDYGLGFMSLEDSKKVAKTTKPNVQMCAKMMYPKIEDGLIPIKNAVNFVNNGGNITSTINNCVKAIHVLALASDRLKDQSLIKEAMALSPRIIAVVSNLNPKLVSAKDVKESLTKPEKFNDTKVSFGSPEYKQLKKECYLFLNQ